MFVMICTILNIAIVGVISRCMSNLDIEHWDTTKRILRYLKGSSNFALSYGGLQFIIKGYIDSYFIGDLDKRKSTTRYVCTLAKGAISCVVIYNRSKIHDNYTSSQESCINQKVIRRTWAQIKEYSSIL